MIASAIQKKLGCSTESDPPGRFDGEPCVYDSYSEVIRVINSQRVMRLLYQNCRTLWICWLFGVSFALFAFVVAHLWNHSKANLIKFVRLCGLTKKSIWLN
jgi:hypothetical protein